MNAWPVARTVTSPGILTAWSAVVRAGHKWW
jgi:hypothetical protein